MTDSIARTITLEELTAKQLKTLLGEYNNHLKYIQQRLDIHINHRQNQFTLSGDLTNIERAELVLQKMAEEAQSSNHIAPNELHLIIQSSLSRSADELYTHTDVVEQQCQSNDQNQHNNNNIKGNVTKMTDTKADQKTKHEQDSKMQSSSHTPQNYTPVTLKTRKGKIVPRGHNQDRYVRRILNSDVSFGVGPAGTGKTYLAVACAVDMLERNEIERILLVRPAVEAGEKLGFLPGDLTQKIDPYLRPLYDALYEMLGFEKVGKLLERQIIEVAPLAYMRGRTLNSSFVILDEAQNTTPEQMKMFLTRLGFGSRAVITGDITQVDLPRGHKSGLAQALHILANIKDIHITKFDSKDVVRHQLVQQIVEAYDIFDAEQEIRKQQIKQQKQQERQMKSTEIE